MDAISRSTVISPYAGALRQAIGEPTPPRPQELAVITDGAELSAAATSPSAESSESPRSHGGLGRVMRGVALAVTFGAVALGTTGCATMGSTTSACWGSECRPYYTNPMIPVPVPVPLPHGGGMRYHFPAPYHGIPGGPHQGLGGGRYAYPGGPNPGWHR